MLKQEEELKATESSVNISATERIVSNLVEPEYAGNSKAAHWPGGECRSEIPGTELTSEVEGAERRERGTKDEEGPFPETNWSEVSRDKSWLEAADMSDSLNLSCSSDVNRNIEEFSATNPSSFMGDAADSMMTLGKIKGEQKESNSAGEFSAGLSVGFKRPLPDTEEGRAILEKLSLPMARLSFKYEANPFEYMSSRWMSLIPNPFVSVVNLALASMMDSIRQPSVALENAKKRLCSSSLQEGSEPPPSRAPGTAYAAHMFSEAERLTSRITEKASSVDVNVTRVSELIPDLTLFSNSYASATIPNEVNLPSTGFLLVSQATSQGCMYSSDKKVSSNKFPLAASDIYGVPREMFNVQNVSAQAPKRWLMVRRNKTGNQSQVCEISGKKLALTRDRHASVENNASILLRVSQTSDKRSPKSG